MKVLSCRAGLALVALLAAGCASKGSGPKDTSGFMSDYSQLKHDAKYKSDWVYIKPPPH